MSNKTPANNDEKIESEPKPKSGQFIFILCLLLITTIVTSMLFFGFLSDRTIFINGQKLNIVAVSKSKDREKGLGGWSRLADNQGILFEYDSPGIYCMWMKDMNFPIDVLWLDSNNKIVSIKQDISQNTYPEVFCPDQEAVNMLEIKSGKVAEYKIELGQSVDM